MPTATRLLHAQARLGEGALWDIQAQVLWWVDINSRELHRFDPATKRDQVWAMPSTIGTVVTRARGGVVVALKNIIAAFDPETATLTTLAGIDQADQRFNDGKCDPAGRLWVGTIDFKEVPNVAALYRLDERGINSQIPGITISNGIVWSKDGRTCWYIDTPTGRIDAFDYDVMSGHLSNRRPAVIFPQEKGIGFPDGMCIDENGRLWVAMWAGGCVLCCDPRTGQIVERIEVPGAHQVTSCAFGGRDLDTLFITSAGGDGDYSDLFKEARLTGREPVQLIGLDLPPALLGLLPAHTANEFGVVPIRLEGDGTLVLAGGRMGLMTPEKELRRISGATKIRFALATPAGLDYSLAKYYGRSAFAHSVGPNAGSLFHVMIPGVRGVPSPSFAH